MCDAGDVERRGQRCFRAVSTGVVGTDDGHRLRPEVVLGNGGHGPRRGGVAAGQEQCVGGVVTGQDRQHADHGNTRRGVGGVVGEEVEADEYQLDVLSGQLLCAGL